MARFSLLPGRVDFAALGQGAQGGPIAFHVGLSAGQGIAYQIPDLANRPRSVVTLRQLWVPIAVSAQDTTANPTRATIQLTLADGSRVFWGDAETLDLIPATFASANTLVVDDLVNPVTLMLEDAPTLQAGVSFDQATSSSAVYIGAQLPNLPASLAPIPSPASVQYDIS